MNQLSTLRERLKGWCESYVARVDTACLVPRRNPFEFCFVVMVRDNHYDIDFADALSKLEMDVEDEDCFGVVTMTVIDLPKISEGRFARMAMSLQRSI